MEQKMIKSILSILVLSLTMGACFYDNEEDLYPNVTCVTDNMSFTTDIYPLINLNCNGCHNATSLQGGINLEGYDNVKEFVDNGGLLGSIQHKSGYKAMPQNADKMSSCNISKIEQWIVQGAQNN